MATRIRTDSKHAERQPPTSNAQSTSIREPGSKRIGGLVAVAMQMALALVALGSSPALALSRTGFTLPGTTVLIQTDPCLPQPQVTGFTASPTSVALGESVKLEWSVQVPDGCNSTVEIQGQAFGSQGTLEVKPLHTTNYELKLSWGSALVSSTWATTWVGVVLPAVVEIDDNTFDWKELLLQALGTPGTTIRLASNIDMDLTGFENIPVARDVTVTSDRELQPVALAQEVSGAPVALADPTVIGSATTAGSTTVATRLVSPDFGIRPTVSGRIGLNLGPRLYTTTRPRPLFAIVCNGADRNGDGVRFSGFRIQGPHWDSEDGDDNLEEAIHVTSCLRVEISNMELSGWSGQAIGIDDPFGYQVVQPEAVKIHDNYIHHNQHIGKFGYGVDTGGGGHALIEQNVFDFNRHAITADGTAYTSYTANRNLVLRGGGYHGMFYEEYIQQFDVHGDDNCFPPGGDSTWNCGNAGESFVFAYNAFQYTAADAIHLRGRPRKGASIHDNVFAHESVDDAVELQTNENVTVGPNTAGVDTFGKYGVCDFDGDGLDDLFLATGVTWWMSSAGRMQWTYLNAASERLGQVALGDFDGDGRCDVFAVHGNEWVISSGGTQPWKSLGSFGVPLSELAFGHFNGGKAMDVFRRAPNGQWSVFSPISLAWRNLNSSSFPLSALRFGDFTGDGIADVLAVQGGHWSISRSGTGSWEPLNPQLSAKLGAVQIADVDGDGTDDVVRRNIDYQNVDPASGSVEYRATWQVSWGGRSNWVTLPPTLSGTFPWWQLDLAPFVGRFGRTPGKDLMLLDHRRFGRVYDYSTGQLSTQDLYAY